MNWKHLFWIIPLTLITGIFLTLWYVAYQIRKAMGAKSWKEFREKVKMARELQKLQKKMEKEGMWAVMNDPKLRKQMEEMKKKFGGI